jgi:hypothetical protein
LRGKEAAMDPRRFEAWTRRRFGLSAGGAIALLFLATVNGLAAKKPMDTEAVMEISYPRP